MPPSAKVKLTRGAADDVPHHRHKRQIRSSDCAQYSQAVRTVLQIGLYIRTIQHGQRSQSDRRERLCYSAKCKFFVVSLTVCRTMSVKMTYAAAMITTVR